MSGFTGGKHPRARSRITRTNLESCAEPFPTREAVPFPIRPIASSPWHTAVGKEGRDHAVRTFIHLRWMSTKLAEKYAILVFFEIIL
jgi:hypothetical protein